MTKQINKLSSKPFINGELLWNKIKREGVSKKWTRQTKVLNDLCCYVINYRIIYPFHIILCRSFIHHTQAMEGINESNMETQKMCWTCFFAVVFKSVAFTKIQLGRYMKKPLKTGRMTCQLKIYRVFTKHSSRCIIEFSKKFSLISLLNVQSVLFSAFFFMLLLH